MIYTNCEVWCLDNTKSTQRVRIISFKVIPHSKKLSSYFFKLSFNVPDQCLFQKMKSKKCLFKTFDGPNVLHLQLFQFTLSDQSFKGTGQDRLPTTSSTWNPNISFIQMARHRRSSLYGRGIVNFADNYSLRSHIPLRSCLVGLRLWSDNVNWNSCTSVLALITH